MSKMLFESPEHLEELIKDYFYECEEKHIKPCVSMMAYKIGTNRQTLLNYENSNENGWLKSVSKEEKEKYIYTIKRAKQYIEACSEQSLINEDKKATGIIFSLKNNYGWADKQEIVQTTNAGIDLSGLTKEQIEDLLKADK